MLRCYKFRVYPQSKKVEREIQRTFRVHAHLYNKAKEERDNNYELYKDVMMQNVLTLLATEADPKKFRFLNDYRRFVAIQDEISVKFDEKRETWRTEGLSQKEKQQLVKVIDEEIDELKSKCDPYRDGYKKAITYVKKKIKTNVKLKPLPKIIISTGQYHLIQKGIYENVNVRSLGMTLRRLDAAFSAFFGRMQRGEGVHPPKFKSWREWDTITFSQSGWTFRDNKVILSYIGKFRVKYHREYSGKVKAVSLTRECGKYWICLSCEDPIDKLMVPRTGKEVGLDVGIKNYITASDGFVWMYPRFLEKIQRQIRILNRKMLTRQRRGSKRRGRTKKQLAKLYYEVKNRRNDFINNLVYELVCKYDVFYVEKLDTKKMLEQKYIIGGKHLRRMISDASFSMFLMKLKNKCEEVGKEVIEVDPRNTSQTCRICGEVKKGMERLTLNDREFFCEKCGHREDRDLNSAKLIYNLGRKIRNKKKLLTV